ncbi:hypothetical protein An16g00580 [Aspergillus niger]|uniref:Uncharacterized protein n=2 Tax=Aspergillus niger TaxID=5061 RepID=A2R6N0_ASPNC|nr:hypothetical protein An16g00580 [Aspergillus niger]CAK46745.1 hypothetical protein An16g00580 [Aspergillus niger]
MAQDSRIRLIKVWVQSAKTHANLPWSSGERLSAPAHAAAVTDAMLEVGFTSRDNPEEPGWTAVVDKQWVLHAAVAVSATAFLRTAYVSLWPFVKSNHDPVSWARGLQ